MQPRVEEGDLSLDIDYTLCQHLWYPTPHIYLVHTHSPLLTLIYYIPPQSSTIPTLVVLYHYFTYCVIGRDVTHIF